MKSNLFVYHIPEGNYGVWLPIYCRRKPRSRHCGDLPWVTQNASAADKPKTQVSSAASPSVSPWHHRESAREWYEGCPSQVPPGVELSEAFFVLPSFFIVKSPVHFVRSKNHTLGKDIQSLWKLERRALPLHCENSSSLLRQTWFLRAPFLLSLESSLG